MDLLSSNRGISNHYFCALRVGLGRISSVKDTRKPLVRCELACLSGSQPGITATKNGP